MLPRSTSDNNEARRGLEGVILFVDAIIYSLNFQSGAAERRGEGREASGSAACGASLSTAMLDAEFTGHCSAQE